MWAARQFVAVLLTVLGPPLEGRPETLTPSLPPGRCCSFTVMVPVSIATPPYIG